MIDAIKRAMGLVSEVVQDPDKANQIIAELQTAKDAAYELELKTKTIPWVDALHKMGRQLLSAGNTAVCAYLLIKHPDIPIESLLMVAGPTAVYSLIKGRGRTF